MKLNRSGQVITKREIKKTGRGAAAIPKVGKYESGEETIVVGPFCVDPVHAEVGGDLAVTLSQNYHSVRVGISVRIPVAPSAAAVKEGLDWCSQTANDYMEHELQGARRALDLLTQ